VLTPEGDFSKKSWKPDLVVGSKGLTFTLVVVHRHVQHEICFSHLSDRFVLSCALDMPAAQELLHAQLKL
jgi:hypothetical protein